ncbi:hypothetical protein Tco_0985642 [Tanacetum coccineum]
MIPQAVLMRSGLKTINTARSRAAVNAAKPKAVHNAVKRNRFHDVKASACWVWKPKNRVIDHGRKITEIDQDPGISLVQHDAEIQGRHEHEPEFDFDAANIPVTTTGAEISTASPEVKTAGDSIEDIAAETLVYIRRSAAKAKDKAVRLQAELDKEERQRISRAEGSSSSSDSEVDSCSKTCVKAYATLKEQYDNLSSDYKKSQFNLVSYKAGLESVEARLAHYKKNEVVFEESINVLKLESLNNKLESQVTDKFKTGLGYDTTTTASPALESFMNLTDMSGSDKGYHLVTPPLTGNFIPRKPNLTFMDEIVESENLDVTTVVTPSNEKTVENKGVFNTVESNTVRRECCASINEELVSDGKKKTVFTTVSKIEFVGPKQPEKPVRKPVKYAEMYRSRAAANAAKPKAINNAVKRNRFHDGRNEHEPEFDFDAANIPVTTTGAEISTTNPEVKTAGDSIEDIAAETLVYIRRSAAKEKDKVAVRLQAELDKEERQRIFKIEGSYALSWKPYQGDSSKLNQPNHRFKQRCCSLIPVEFNSLLCAPTQATQTYYKHQDSRIKKAQELNTKTSANSDIQDLPKDIKIIKTMIIKGDC